MKTNNVVKINPEEPDASRLIANLENRITKLEQENAQLFRVAARLIREKADVEMVTANNIFISPDGTRYI